MSATAGKTKSFSEEIRIKISLPSPDQPEQVPPCEHLQGGLSQKLGIWLRHVSL